MNVESTTRDRLAAPQVSIGESRKLKLRRLLMIVIPACALLIGAVAYLAGGRFVGTENAYVKADIANLSPEISGNIVEILVGENEPVKKGQPLLRLDDTNYRFAVAQAEADIRSARATVDTDRAQLRQKEQAIAIAQTDLAFAERELKRQNALGAGRFVSQSKIDELRHAYDNAQQRIALSKNEQAEILAKLQGDPNLPVEQHPSYQAAIAHLAAAKHFVELAVLTAPFDGVVTHLPKIGDYARSGVPALSIVSRGTWVDANFKETQLTFVRPGQPAEIRVDTYPGRVFKGHVESIAQASGGEFALLPAQNSNGNWVKVVQRIPVRIALDETVSDQGPVLRAGMSVVADVDTGTRRIGRWLGQGSSAAH